MDRSSILLFVFMGAFVICLIIMASSAWSKEKIWTAIFGFGAVVLFVVVLAGTAVELGYGYVIDTPKAFTKRLDSGTAYRLVSSAKDGTDQILLVRKEKANEDGKFEFFALRTETVPPEHFTLVDGKPVAIVESSGIELPALPAPVVIKKK